jgi:hypothetical protein
MPRESHRGAGKDKRGGVVDDTVQDPQEWPEAGVCGRWVGDRYCRAVDDVHPYPGGHRCGQHSPAALQGIPEPPPGPGWVMYRKAGAA